MSQKEVFDFLNQNKNQFFACKDIAKILNKNLSTISRNLTKLNRSGLISSMSTNRINYHVYCIRG